MPIPDSPTRNAATSSDPTAEQGIQVPAEIHNPNASPCFTNSHSQLDPEDNTSRSLNSQSGPSSSFQGGNDSPIIPTTSIYIEDGVHVDGKYSNVGLNYNQLHLTPSEIELLHEVGHPDPLHMIMARDEEGFVGLFSAPCSDKVTRRRLKSSRDIAAPYGNGVFRTRREIDLRVPRDSYGGVTITCICDSPEPAPSNHSLPFL